MEASHKLEIEWDKLVVYEEDALIIGLRQAIQDEELEI